MTFQRYNSRAASLTGEQVVEMRKFRAESRRTWTYERLAVKYSVTPNTVRNVCLGLTWQHLPMFESSEDMKLNIAESERKLDAMLEADPVLKAINEGRAAPRLKVEERPDLFAKLEEIRKNAKLSQETIDMTDYPVFRDETVVKQSDADRMLDELIKEGK